MSGQFSITDAEKKIQDIRLDKYLQLVAKEHKTTLRKLSLLIGQNENYVQQQLRLKKVNIALLHALTVHLKVNLFEPFLNQLPENLRATGREAALQQENEALKKQLDDLMKERDIYKGILMK